MNGVGAAIGLVSAMQQVGGFLGQAVLVTVFGAASKNSEVDPSPTPREAVKLVFVVDGPRVLDGDRVLETAAAE